MRIKTVKEKALKIMDVLEKVWPVVYPCLVILGMVLLAVCMKKGLNTKNVDLLVGMENLDLETVKKVAPAIISYVAMMVGCAFALCIIVLYIVVDDIFLLAEKLKNMRQSLRSFVVLSVPIGFTLVFILSLVYFIY